MTKTKKDKDVITKEEEKKATDIINEEFNKIVEEVEAPEVSDNDAEPEEVEVFDDDVTPLEQLAWSIGGFLADRTAERFSEMVSGMEIDLIKRIVHRLENSKPEQAVSMLQMMFMVSGMEHAAEDLDIIGFCNHYSDCSYDFFIDDLFQTDVFDWFLVDNWIEEGIERRKQDELLREAIAWQRR